MGKRSKKLVMEIPSEQLDKFEAQDADRVEETIEDGPTVKDLGEKEESEDGSKKNKRIKTNSCPLKSEDDLVEHENQLKMIARKRKQKIDEIPQPSFLNKIDELFTSSPAEDDVQNEDVDGFRKHVEIVRDRDDPLNQSNEGGVNEKPFVEMNIVTLSSDMNFFLDESDLVNNFFSPTIRKDVKDNWTTKRSKEIIEAMSKVRRHHKRNPKHQLKHFNKRK